MSISVMISAHFFDRHVQGRKRYTITRTNPFLRIGESIMAFSPISSSSSPYSSTSVRPSYSGVVQTANKAGTAGGDVFICSTCGMPKISPSFYCPTCGGGSSVRTAYPKTSQADYAQGKHPTHDTGWPPTRSVGTRAGGTFYHNPPVNGAR